MKDGKIDKLHRHAFTCIMHWLRERETEEAKVMEEIINPSKNEETSDIQDATKAELLVPQEDAAKWADILSDLQSTLSDTDFRTWFGEGTLSILSYEDNVLTLSSPNRSYLDIVWGKFGSLIEGAIRAKWGNSVRIAHRYPK